MISNTARHRESKKVFWLSYTNTVKAKEVQLKFSIQYSSQDNLFYLFRRDTTQVCVLMSSTDLGMGHQLRLSGL